MASIVTAVLKATVGLLVNKGRDFAADKLKEGDVTEEQFRNMIVREIDDIKSKLDGLARKDLLTSISFFKEGIMFLYKVLDTKSSGGASTATEQSAVTQGAWENTTQHSLRTLAAGVEKVSLAKGMETLDGSGKRALADAKKRFDDARMKATEAFNNVALSTSDRILAMQYRVLSTILEKIDNPKEAIAACRLCLEELHFMPAVQKSFNVEETGGFFSLFNKSEREEIIQSVRDINRVIFKVTEMADGVLSKEFDTWPCVNSGGKEVNPLIQRGDNAFHSRVLPWSFGQEGEEEHKLSHPQSITTNTQGQFIVADNNHIKIFDQSGKFIFLFFPTSTFDEIKDVATDRDDNVYVLTISSKISVFDKQGHMRCTFGEWSESEGISVTVNENQRVFVLLKLFDSYNVKEYEADGQYVNNYSLMPYGRQPTCITTANDNRIMVLITDVHNDNLIFVFDAQGHLLTVLSGSGSISSDLQIRIMAFHLSTEHILIPSRNYNGGITIEIRTRKGKRSHTFHLKTERIHFISGMTVTTDGRIAVLCTTQENTEENDRKSEKHVVFVV